MKKIILASIVLAGIFTGTVSAQVATATGKVTMKQADGTEIPVQKPGAGHTGS